MNNGTTNVRNYTDLQLIERVESLPTFKGWKKGKCGIQVRSSENGFNIFDDKFYNFECFKDGERPIFHSWDVGTTNAGALGLMNFEKYNALGCAVLKSDHVAYDTWHYGFHKNDPKKPAYKQVRPHPHFRDNDKDKLAEEIGKEYNEIIGANQHGTYKSEPELIGGHSVACLVRRFIKQYNAWLKWMNKEPLVLNVILKEFQ